MHLKLFVLLPSALLMLAMLTLAACSSMEPDSIEERFGNQVPADFDWKVFDKLNPEIRLAQVVDNFKQENDAWIWEKRVELGGEGSPVGVSVITRDYLNPYRNASIVWGTYCTNSLNAGSSCCSADDKITATDGIGIKIMQTYLNWTDEMICDMKTASTGTNPTATDFKEGYVYRFLLYGRQGEEMEAIDALISPTAIDSAVFYRNYILYGRETGLAYRVCKDNEMKPEKSRDALVVRDFEYISGGLKEICNSPQPANSKVTCNSSCVCNYSAYEFCADETNPHKLYVVAEKN